MMSESSKTKVDCDGKCHCVNCQFARDVNQVGENFIQNFGKKCKCGLNFLSFICWNANRVCFICARAVIVDDEGSQLNDECESDYSEDEEERNHDDNNNASSGDIAMRSNWTSLYSVDTSSEGKSSGTCYSSVNEAKVGRTTTAALYSSSSHSSSLHVVPAAKLLNMAREDVIQSSYRRTTILESSSLSTQQIFNNSLLDSSADDAYDVTRHQLIQDEEKEVKRRRDQLILDQQKEFKRVMLPRKRTSIIWQHFTEENTNNPFKKEERLVRCNHCRTWAILFSGSTTGAKIHLTKCHQYQSLLQNNQQHQQVDHQNIAFKRKHSKQSTNLAQTRLLQQNDGSLSIQSSINNSSAIYRSALAEMILVDGLPFSCLEGIGLRSFFHVLIPEFTIPNQAIVRHDVFNKVLPALEESLLAVISEEIAKNTIFSTTIDMWTATADESEKVFMVVTLHWMDLDWNKRYVALSVDELDCPHSHVSGGDISTMYLNALMTVGIPTESVLTCTIKSTSNTIDFKNVVMVHNAFACEGEYFYSRCNVMDLYSIKLLRIV
mmetsp:Transcript_27993/g.38494  ORF Transcript_27993/g.38494 Transcript_27993/m.38494 type:complete len:549 (+) Transcript_27993:76-1722(+)